MSDIKLSEFYSSVESRAIHNVMNLFFKFPSPRQSSSGGTPLTVNNLKLGCLHSVACVISGSGV
jgi:hypothetical protein